MKAPSENTRWVIIGAGFAGAATAWALGRAGLGPGVVLEQEPAYGAHASGRNAGLLRLAEHDPLIRALAVRSLRHLRELDGGTGEIIRPIGALTLASEASAADLVSDHDALLGSGIPATVMSAPQARAQFAFLSDLNFDRALFCPAEGLVDVHALLTCFLRLARQTGFELYTGCRVEDLLVESGGVSGVRAGGREIRAEAVVDASGAWAGNLGRASAPLPLQPLRRHLFVSGPVHAAYRNCPFTWLTDGALYFRPEGDGLLFSPCDETPWPPGVPPTDPAAVEALAEKVSRYAPGLADMTIRRGWACLRTFAPDRRPVIGPDPARRGLYYVCGLGGFGVTASAAIGELLAAHVSTGSTEWIDLAALTPARLPSAAPS